MFDSIHDIATGFRKIVRAFSYPGEKISLEKEVLELRSPSGMFPGSALFARTLLDSETTFCIIGNGGATHQDVREITYAKVTSPEEAQFAFLLEESTEEERLTIFEKACIGDLMDPHLGAMILMEVSEFDGICYRLTGPGIKDSKEICLPLSEALVKLRTERNSDYPTGFDLLLIDAKHQILALPRTTKLERIQ